MEDNRTHPRIQIDTQIRVTDRNSGQIIGTLGNISLGGFMLISEESLPLNRLYQFTISFPQPDGSTKNIEVGADSLWSQQLPNENTFWFGFQIIDVSEEDARLIEHYCAE